MTLKELINEGKRIINADMVDGNLVLKILIEHFFNIERDKIIIHMEDEIEKEKIEEYINAIKKLNDGVPVQYITNNQEFMKLNFYVDENVLIPQPDTEILVEEVIDKYKSKSCKILDLCTGSGAIAISLAKYIDGSSIVASDISSKAIQVAKLNAEKNVVHKKITFIESDMFENMENMKFDAIVSNPPYIEEGIIKNLDSQVQKEPHIALSGGVDGLDFYRIIAKEAPNYLSETGTLFLEIGYDQKDKVVELLKKTNMYKKIYVKKDLENNDRVVVAEI